MRVGRVLDRDLVGHAQAVALEADDLLRVVRQQADLAEPEVDEDLGADAVVAQVGRQAELQVRVDGVEALLLELVGAQLVEQADPAALLREVEEHALALLLDAHERVLELLAAVAAQRVEDVAGQALGVDADEHVVLPLDLALDHRDVVLVVDERAEADGLEVAERRRQAGLDDALDELVVLAAVRDQVGDRDHLQVVPRQYSSRSGTRAIVPSSFMISQITPDGLRPARRARSTAASVWPVRSSTPPGFAFSGKMWPGWTRSRGSEFGSIATWIVCARSCAEMPVVTPSRASIETVNAVSKRRLVLGRHQVEAELVAALRRQRQADQAAAVLGHEVDRLGRRELGGERQVALVLAVLGVDDDDHLAGADVGDRVLDRGEAGVVRSCRLHSSRHQLLDVLGEYVDLDVDGAAGRERPASCARASRGSGRPTTSRRPLGDRQRDAVEATEPFSTT